MGLQKSERINIIISEIFIWIHFLINVFNLIFDQLLLMGYFKYIDILFWNNAFQDKGERIAPKLMTNVN